MANNRDKDAGNKKANTPEDQNRETDFPGYPHYPASEDLLNPANGARKVSADPDELNRQNAFSATRKRTDEEQSIAPLEDEEEMDDELEIVSGTEADVTPEDLELLGPKDADMDMGDDELLNRVKLDNPDSGDDDDLDVPGSELDDENENLGEEDEENNYYSLGGDRHDSLEEDNQQEPESD